MDNFALVHWLIQDGSSQDTISFHPLLTHVVFLDMPLLTTHTIAWIGLVY